MKIFYSFFTYFLCATPFGVLISKLFFGKDVRDHGSGNTGATNVSRLLGKKWGVLVLFLDALKGYLAVFIACQIFGTDLLFVNFIGVLAVLAHCYPVYLKFKGGKGVATALGVFAALDPKILGLAAVVFLLVVALSRRISLGSLAGALAVPILCFLIANSHLHIVAASVITFIVWWKHRENIKRLLKRQEPRFF